MSLKMLSRFQKFDAERFFADKKFLFTKVQDWREGSDQSNLHVVGCKVSGLIAVDETNYGKDLTGVNEGEIITFKVRQPIAKFQNWEPLQTVFQATNFSRVVIWGDYRNQLSVRVPDLQEIKN